MKMLLLLLESSAYCSVFTLLIYEQLVRENVSTLTSGSAVAPFILESKTLLFIDFSYLIVLVWILSVLGARSLSVSRLLFRAFSLIGVLALVQQYRPADFGTIAAVVSIHCLVAGFVENRRHDFQVLSLLRESGILVWNPVFACGVFAFIAMVTSYMRVSYLAIPCLLVGAWIITVPELKNKKKVTFQSHTGKLVSFPQKAILIAWLTLHIVLACFTIVPPFGNSIFSSLRLCGAALVLLVLILVYSTDMIGFSSFRLLQLSLIMGSTIISVSLDDKVISLNFYNQCSVWFNFVMPPLLPSFSYGTPLKRYLGVFAGLAAPTILLSTNIEVLFYAVIGALLYLWLIIERCIMYERKKDVGLETNNGNKESSRISSDDSRTACFFVFYAVMCLTFFGNELSLDSFSFTGTHRFFLSSSNTEDLAMLLCKLLLPLTLVATVATNISKEKQAGKFSKLFLGQWILLCQCFIIAMFVGTLQILQFAETGGSALKGMEHFFKLSFLLASLPICFGAAALYVRSLEFRLVDLKDLKNR